MSSTTDLSGDVTVISAHRHQRTVTQQAEQGKRIQLFLALRRANPGAKCLSSSFLPARTGWRRGASRKVTTCCSSSWQVLASSRARCVIGPGYSGYRGAEELQGADGCRQEFQRRCNDGSGSRVRDDARSMPSSFQGRTLLHVGGQHSGLRDNSLHTPEEHLARHLRTRKAFPDDTDDHGTTNVHVRLSV